MLLLRLLLLRLRLALLRLLMLRLLLLRLRLLVLLLLRPGAGLRRVFWRRAHRNDGHRTGVCWYHACP